MGTRTTDNCLATIRKHHFQISVGYSQSSHFTVKKLTVSSHNDCYLLGPLRSNLYQKVPVDLTEELILGPPIRLPFRNDSPNWFVH